MGSGDKAILVMCIWLVDGAGKLYLYINLNKFDSLAFSHFKVIFCLKYSKPTIFNSERILKELIKCVIKQYIFAETI